MSPHAIGVAFGKFLTPSSPLPVVHGWVASDLSAFVIIIWVAYSGVAIVKFSSLLRTVVRGATVYFIMVMVIQAMVVLFILFADVRSRPLPVPILLTHSPSGYDKPIPTYVSALSSDLKSLTNP